MNRTSDKKKLLNDVFSESAAEDFRAALLGETLRHARGRRRTRLLWRTSPLLLVLGLAWLLFPGRRTITTGSPLHATVEIVATQPLAPTSWVSTRPLAVECVVISTPGAYIVRTKPAGEGFRLIDDAELMAFAAPRPAILMRLGPTSQRLIFTDDKGMNEPRAN
jgi:hypothetical protein